MLSYSHMWLAPEEQRIPDEIVNEHERIVQALERGRHERALQLLERHRSRSRTFLTTLVNEPAD